ncbi:ankyrin repeat domain-containing protein [Aspergillus mulundensis]|uniref:Uncharacterized protein n=1 Tax=Aspergillus mulundensis TaxID=1810919 RepID=A0A3D8R9G8_9EURO|nr:Uncharacterized protein DSM5745_08059 [Aspergillus mulundensis]RDW70548.1 Uncharacterized protein DSM5745_08059 [Aspergillus mulundensis]
MEPDDAFHRAFCRACRFGDLPSTQEAIATGRLTVEQLNEGLKYATRMRQVGIATLLFDAGASVSTWTVDSLPGEYLQQDPRIVRLFLERGLDPNARLSTGEPLLPMFSNPECAALLLSAGADPNRPGAKGIPPIARAIVGTREPSTSLIELYLAHGAKLESTLLFYSLMPRVPQHELMTRFLLDKGVDPNVTSNDWGTPLHLAVRVGKVNLAKMLLEAGADPTVVSCGRKIGSLTPAQVAEEDSPVETREEILRLLESYSGQP